MSALAVCILPVRKIFGWNPQPTGSAAAAELPHFVIKAGTARVGQVYRIKIEMPGVSRSLAPGESVRLIYPKCIHVEDGAACAFPNNSGRS